MEKLTLEEAVRRLLIPPLARRLGIAAEIPERDGQTVRCWFPDRHAGGDRNPSFNVFEGGTRFNCFACEINGRGPDLIAAVLGLPEDEAIRRFIAMAGGETVQTHHQPPRARKALTLPPDCHEGADADWWAVASLRRINPNAVKLAAELGVLRFGTVHSFPCWIVADGRRLIAEARRMDGLPFPQTGTLGERKAHTLAGSDKSWPVGLQTVHSHPENFQRFALVEGGPDLLAAFHFMVEQGEFGTLPAAMLGRNCRRIHPDAMAYFKGKSVRIFPHADEDSGGIKAAQRWNSELLSAGAAKVDAFICDGLTRRDGKPVKDLNDCTVIRDEDKPELEGLFA